MKKNPFEDNVLLNAINRITKDTIITDIKENYLYPYIRIKKWILFSDYCFSSDKSNIALTFSFFPIMDNFYDIQNYIKAVAPKDIKNSKNVNNEFSKLIKNGQFLNFSFITNNNPFLMWYDRITFKEAILKDLTNFLKNKQIEKRFTQSFIEKINKVIKLVKENKKLHIFSQFYFIVSIAGFLSGILNDTIKFETLYWASDRDAIHDICDDFSYEIFSSVIYTVTKKKLDIAYMTADSNSDEWYKEFNRIPDYLSGTLADYNFAENKFSHDKFAEIFHNCILNNNRNIFVYNLNFQKKK